VCLTGKPQPLTAWVSGCVFLSAATSEQVAAHGQYVYRVRRLTS